ncbi:DUF4435 domain-containing protein [Pedobacter sp. D749]|uniref:DUF4435 domain-containing protein n=1 Tax=Pedobacter sp. D749 TaxID=2856523 RepID=UPI001C57820C|nr:DUF4435 domain-containing protein [Pedobacter sp. D749]QXU39999.1 DUF4435 domain-containing protein [Pedobacter sp. D749]
MKQADITYQDKLIELRLDIKHPNNHNITYVLVEGETDIRFFKKFFNVETSKVESVPGGKLKVEDCTEELLKIRDRVIGIRDSDFINLFPKTNPKTNIFFSDWHDIEILMIYDDEVFSSILFEFTSIASDKHSDIRLNLLKSIREISLLKWLNEIEDLRLDFDSTSFHILISFKTFQIDFDTYFDRLIKKSINAKIKDLEIVKSKIFALQIKNPDFFQLTNGHDFLKTLAHFFREEFKHNGITDNLLGSICRLKFTADMFKKTQLRNEILKWSEMNKCQILN